MHKISNVLILLEICILSFGAFSSSKYFLWGSIITYISYRLLIGRVEDIKKIDFQFTPIKIYKGFWYFLLVFSPLTNNIWKPPQFPLPFLPENESHNLALLLTAMSGLASYCGFKFKLKKKANIRKTLSGQKYLPIVSERTQANTMIILGLFGILTLLSTTILSVGISESFATLTPNASSLPKFLSIVLPPFALHGVLLRFSNIKKPGSRDISKLLFYFAICITPFTLFRLNRASIFIPAFVLFAVLIVSKSRYRYIITWVILFALGVLGVQIVGNFRAEQIVTKAGHVSLTSVGYVEAPSIKTQLFNYLNSAEYIGYGLQEIDRREVSVLTPLYSIADPLPKLSKLNSDNIGGTGLYNRAIYHRNVYDQICASILEIYLAWGLLGIIVFFLFQGFLIRQFSIRFLGENSAYYKYVYLYCGFWMSFLPCISISVLVQIFFYNVLFIGIYLKLFKTRARLD